MKRFSLAVIVSKLVAHSDSVMDFGSARNLFSNFYFLFPAKYLGYEELEAIYYSFDTSLGSDTK